MTPVELNTAFVDRRQMKPGHQACQAGVASEDSPGARVSYLQDDGFYNTNVRVRNQLKPQAKGT